MRKSRILIVEDEVLVAMVLADHLKRLGYEIVAEAGSGEEAVRKALELQPDVVLMDIKLPGEIDGIEAASQLRSHVDAAIVYTTGHSGKDLVERAGLTEPHGFITKPYSWDDVDWIVETAIYKHQEEKRLREGEKPVD